MTATVPERFTGAGGDVAGSLRWICRRLGLTPDPAAVEGAATRRLAIEREFGEPRPEAMTVLRSLHERGLRIGVISDCTAELPVYFPGLPLVQHVHAAVFSFVTGHHTQLRRARHVPTRGPRSRLGCLIGHGRSE